MTAVAQKRLGLSLGTHDALAGADMLQPAIDADAGGYELALVPEAWGHEAFGLLGYLAARTTRIKLGPGIVNVYSRSPAVLAMSAATLDDLSGGRAVLGLGTSGQAVVEGWHGTPMTHPLSRLREVTEAVRLIHRRERSGYQGNDVKIAPGFSLRMPVTRSGIEIFHASMTPAAVRQCGRIADGWIPTVVSPPHLEAQVRLIEDGLAAAGRQRSGFTVAPHLPAFVSDDLAAARTLMRRHVAYYIGGMGRFYHEAIERQGYAAATVEVRRLWAEKRLDEANAAVTDELVDLLTICGPRDRCLARLDEYRAAGADVPILARPLGASHEQWQSTIRVLAPATM